MVCICVFCRSHIVYTFGLDLFTFGRSGRAVNLEFTGRSQKVYNLGLDLFIIGVSGI